MKEQITVGIADINIAEAPGTLITYALGSCVGICLLDPVTKLGGLAHIMLPASKELPNVAPSNKFADIAIEALILGMEKRGAPRSRLKAKIAGGACMFGNITDLAISNIGGRNVSAVKMILLRNRIPVLAEDTGKDYGRTLLFYPDTGVMQIKSALKGESSW